MHDRELIRMLKALADETRFRIVQQIASSGEVTCGEIAECVALAQPTVSHHLKVLLDAGVITMRVEGKHHHLSVNHALLGTFRALLRARLGPGSQRSRG